ncbi:hypothetical protein AHiyo4_37180 [Arthrobacter sp. Hiyo4]|nr:hypothetical protein AHiyo4_37180 [Arthrobacter sp. Hiyo4]
MCRVHGQRRQDREDLFGEHGTELLLGGVIQFVPVHQVDVLVGQGGADLFGVDLGMALLEAVGFVPDLFQHLDRAKAGRGGHGEVGGDAPLQARHPDHKELVQVGRKDGQEGHAFQEVERRIFGEFQDAGVERQPAELAVQKTVRPDVPFGHKVGCKLGDVDPVLRCARGRDFG